MNDLLLLWLSLSLSGSMVAVILILLRPLLKRFGYTWQYYIWLLVILRFLIPFSPDVSIVGGLFEKAGTQFAVSVQQVVSAGGTTAAKPDQAADISTAKNGGEAEAGVIIAVTMPTRDHIWGMLWLTVALGLLMRKIIGYGRLLKAVGTQSKVITQGQLPEVLHTVCQEMDIRKSIRIGINPLIRTPMLIGILRPMVVLPSETVPVSGLELIIKHELIHYRRGDILYKWLVEAAVCLHWFNPIVYWVRKQMNRDCELSCDEMVVSHLEDTQRRVYGAVLLRSMESWHKEKIVSLYLSEDGKMIGKRLDVIKKYRRRPKHIRLFAAMVTVVLLCGAILAGSYTAKAAEHRTPDKAAAPIRVGSKDIAPGGKISLGSKKMEAGSQCSVLLSWSGEQLLTVLCTASGGDEKTFTVKNGEVVSFRINTAGEYTVAVKNQNDAAVRNVSGTIKVKQDKTIPQQSVVYEKVEMLKYDDYQGVEGYPYAHDTRTNHTDKKIVSTERGMLAFDKEGYPLKINWYELDSENRPSYFYLYDSDIEEILPGQTDDTFGGWTLNALGSDENVALIQYVLYCDKKIVFEDGTVWTNPDFDNWKAKYEGEKTDVEILKQYYPYTQTIQTN